MGAIAARLSSNGRQMRGDIQKCFPRYAELEALLGKAINQLVYKASACIGLRALAACVSAAFCSTYALAAARAPAAMMLAMASFAFADGSTRTVGRPMGIQLQAARRL